MSILWTQTKALAVVLVTLTGGTVNMLKNILKNLADITIIVLLAFIIYQGAS